MWSTKTFPTWQYASDLCTHTAPDPWLLSHPHFSFPPMILWATVMHLTKWDWAILFVMCVHTLVKESLLVQYCGYQGLSKPIQEGSTGMTAMWAPVRTSWDPFMLVLPLLLYIQLESVHLSRLYGTKAPVVWCLQCRHILGKLLKETCCVITEKWAKCSYPSI